MKSQYGLAALSSLLAFASAAPASHAVHEKRDRQFQQWNRRDVKLNKDAIIPMSFGLTQRNLDKGYEYLMDVSHPESSNYGKHWSMEKVCFLRSSFSFPNDVPRSLTRLPPQKAPSQKSSLGLQTVVLHLNV